MRVTIKEGTTAEEIGAALAQHFRWEGGQIVECMLAALTDANFHTLAAQVDALYKQGE
jgi:hypothetical protein